MMYCWQVASPGVYGSISPPNKDFGLNPALTAFGNHGVYSSITPPNQYFGLNPALTAFGNPGVYSSIIPRPPKNRNLVLIQL